MANYYVDPVGGDNGDDGSTGTPWLTVAYSLTQMSNNDTLNCRDGNYYAANLATALTGITIQADSGHSPVMISTTLYASGSWSKTGGQTNVYETAYTSGFCFVVYHGSQRLASVGSVATCDSTEKSFYFDDAGNKLYVHVTGGAAPGDIHVDAALYYWLTINGTGCTIKDITIDHFAQGISVPGSATLINIAGTNFMAQANNRNFIYTTGTVTLTDCAVTGATVAGLPWGYALQAAAGTTAVTITGCTFDNLRYPIRLLAGTATITTTTITGALDCIYASNAAAVTITNSTLINGTHSAVILENTATVNMQYCTVYIDYDTAGTSYGIVFHASGTSYVYHSVFAWLTRSTSAGYQQALYYAPTSDTLTITAKNNAVYQCRVAHHYQSGTVTYDLDYSGLYANSVANYVSIDPGDQGANDVTSDPTYTDAANEDFTLLTGSPYIDAGLAIAGINDGYSGSAPDIGRYEVAGGSIVPIAMHHYIMRS